MADKSLPCVLICVSDMMRCHRLIDAGKAIAQEMGASLKVLSVQPKSAFHRKTGNELETLFRAVRKAGGDMTVYYDDRGGDIVLQYIKKNPVCLAVLGAPGPHSNAMALRLRDENPGLPIRQIDGTPETDFVAVRGAQWILAT